MTKQLKATIAAMLLFGTVSMHAQAGDSASTQTKTKKTRTTKPKKETQEQKQLRDLQEKLAAQQAQIDALTQQNSAKDAAVSQAQSAATAAQTQATEATTQAQAAAAAAQSQADQVNTLKSTVTDLQSNSVGVAQTLSTTKQELSAEIPKVGPIALQDFKIGVTFFGGWSYYNATGFSEQWMDTPTEQLGPGNDGFNTFEVNRAYVNFLYTPNERVALRITPDIYRVSDGSYSYRLKYAFADIQKIFGKGAFKNDKITIGQTQQPLTDWEEGLSGHRYTYLTPWNYLHLSSTYAGIKLHGPIEAHGKEYVDYDLGVFNNANFHAVETNENKQFMFRATVYPLGTTSDRTGLGFTIFNDYGYKSALPPASQTSLDRLAALVHYQTHSKRAQFAFEYDWGHNAYSTGNLFSGAGSPSGAYAAFNTAASAALAGSNTHQRGFATFDHVSLGKSRFELWGLFQYFQPNTDYNYSAAGYSANPVDYNRTIGGIGYSVSKQFDISVGDENFHWVHPQTLNTGGDTNGIGIWTQFNF